MGKPAKKRLPRTKYNTEELTEIFSRFRQQRPEPKGELNHVNPYTLVVAVALSAQATDAGVNRATKELFKVADTPEKMLALGEEKVGEYIKTIGLWRNKAKNVIKLSQMLVDDFDSIVPREREERVNVVGPLCTPLDLLADKMTMSEAQIGDLIVVFQSGAYGYTASPRDFLSHRAPQERLI